MKLNVFLVARNLKDVHGCRFVIALTHMRTPNDVRLAKEVEEIDLILGGHDHVSEFIEVPENAWKKFVRHSIFPRF